MLFGLRIPLRPTEAFFQKFEPEDRPSSPGGKKFAYPPEIARNIVRELEAVSELVFPTRKIAAVKADPCDNLILECAVKAGVDYVLSGDNHLLELRRFEGIPILSPAQFL